MPQIDLIRTPEAPVDSLFVPDGAYYRYVGLLPRHLVLDKVLLLSNLRKIDAILRPLAPDPSKDIKEQAYPAALRRNATPRDECLFGIVFRAYQADIRRFGPLGGEDVRKALIQEYLRRVSKGLTSKVDPSY